VQDVMDRSGETQRTLTMRWHSTRGGLRVRWIETDDESRRVRPTNRSLAA